MKRLSGKTAEKVLRAAKIGAVAGFALQAAAIATVVAVDERRKRREPSSGQFPHVPPTDAHVADSTLTTYTYGNDLFEDMLAAIDAATETVYFETFIWKKDETGRRFREAIIRAARRGVDTYVIVDSFGNLNQDPRFRRFPKLDTLHVLRFPLFRWGLLTGSMRNSGRDHRKLLVTDSSTAFVGGYNIGSLYAEHWRDTHLRIVGPQVWELENAFIDMWNSHRPRGEARIANPPPEDWTAEIRAIQNLPSRLSYPIRSSYLDALDRSRDHAWITMGYFIPDRDMQESLIEAARRGVDVRILVPEYSNHIIADWVGRPHFSSMMEAGVRIFLFESAMVHSKTMTMDGKWSTIGTANIDRLSMQGNFEINVEIFSKEQAQIMEEIFRVDLTNAHELTRQEWERRPAGARLIERILRPLGIIL
ncbi:MAG: phospholipase D-like domain-containing protein [Flaviflexus sp.]|nr:phospholipase D-like domain-containing protein [Flaviflexus sp.]